MCSMEPGVRLSTEDVDVTVQRRTSQTQGLAAGSAEEREARKALPLARSFVDRQPGNPALERAGRLHLRLMGSCISCVVDLSQSTLYQTTIVLEIWARRYKVD